MEGEMKKESRNKGMGKTMKVGGEWGWRPGLKCR